MADSKPTRNSYNLLGGINEKTSEYSEGAAEFYSLYNLDFHVPNALQKRPGSTQFVNPNTSGPITSLFEFEKLNGASWVVAGSDTAMFYLASNAYTLLDTGWSNGQPADMLTFVDRLWMANGQKWRSWDGTTLFSIGLPCANSRIEGDLTDIASGNASLFSIMGATMQSATDPAGLRAAVYAAYGYVRADGYLSPIDFISNARLVTPVNIGISPKEWSDVTQSNYGQSVTYPIFISGFSIPTGMGISAIALFLAQDQFTGAPNLGYRVPNFPSSFTLSPDADLTRFYYYATYPVSTLTLTISGITNWSEYVVQNGLANFSGTPVCYFDSHIPKYIDINQNIMFMAGFSGAPSEVWFSDVGDPESLQPENRFEVRTNDGDRVMAIKAYSNQLLILKERSFHKVFGDSADNFALVELSTQYGCISNKTVVEFKEKLAWLDRRGVLEFNGSSWDIISTPVESTFRRMNLAVAREKACAVNFTYRNQLWFGIPLDSSTQNNVTVVYDYLIGAWTFFDGFNPASFALMKSTLNTPTVFTGNYSGVIRYFHESFYGDNGQGITCYGELSFDKTKENETNMFRRFFLDNNRVSGGVTGVINCRVFADYDRTTVRQTFAIYQNQFQTRAEIGVPGKAVAADFSHNSASLPLLINGYSWAWRFLRNV